MYECWDGLKRMTDLQTILAELNNLSSEDLHAVQRHLEDMPHGNIIAANVSLEDYMEHYAADHCEWVEGYVIQMSPAELIHNSLLYYLYRFLETYFEIRKIGRVIGQPFVMRLAAFPKRRREPDLLVILNTNPHELKNTYLDGPADICIEIVSEESTGRDHGEKFKEYEKGGVPEYWILDPIHREGRFYRLNAEGRYTRYNEDEKGNYTTPTLAGLLLHVPTLWREELPTPAETVKAISAMLIQHP
jgi:Uma2 family endonuclease